MSNEYADIKGLILGVNDDGDTRKVLVSDDGTLKINSDVSVANFGGKYISSTDATTPSTGYVFNAIQVITDCVITCVGNITGITSVSLTAGTIIYGRYTSITLSSGSVIAYYGV
jgi:hypothetical protein